jgi:hypothetical protein
LASFGLGMRAVMRATNRCAVHVIATASVLAGATGARAQPPTLQDLHNSPCCEYAWLPPLVWSGTDPVLTAATLAAHCAPILWFSPDEPLLRDKQPAEIRVPSAFPFEDPADAPVVYYRVRSIVREGGHEAPAYSPDPTTRGDSQIDLRHIRGIDLDFFFYYPSEEGFGGHPHDVESVQMTLLVWKRPRCSECPYTLGVSKVVGKAHGVVWYDNTLMTDRDTQFPITILVEEGKHASCTDKNGDGYFTPGYDVNRRVNDAWGVRDVIRGGGLFSGGFESWFAKVRKPEHRIFPPLPSDNLNLARLHKARADAGGPVYELRPFPRAEQAAGDPHLVPFIADKGSPDWPDVMADVGVKAFRRSLGDEGFGKSLSVSLRADGDVGVSFVFPLFIVKNFSDPLAGGWLVNRIYLMDDGLRDFGYGVLYSTSASRWIDGYASIGYESDEGDDGAKRRYWVGETGLKFRANIAHSPLRFLGKLTDFWGLRIGVKGDGLLPIERMGVVLELGAGTF